jgi:hypothetical protein
LIHSFIAHKSFSDKKYQIWFVDFNQLEFPKENIKRMLFMT